MRILPGLLAAAVLAPFAAFGDEGRKPAAVDVLGFSPDGRYVAIVEHGIGEGSGLPFARAAILDAKANATAARPATVNLESEGATEADAVAEARKQLASEQKRLGIAEWQPAHRVELKGEKNDELWDRGGAPLGNVSVLSRKTKGKEACDRGYQARLLTVLFELMGDDGPQKFGDRKLPAERPCVKACKIESIWAHNTTAVLALVTCGVPGFEGAGARTFGIAGRLDLPLDPYVGEQ